MSDQLPPDAIPVPTSVGDVPSERLHAVFDGMFDGVWMVSPAGLTTYANEAMAGLLGLSRLEMQGRALNDFIDASLWPVAEAFLERQRTTAGERIEMPFRRADGRDLVGMLAGSPISTAEGVFVGTMLNFSDVTAKRAYEAQLAQNEKMQAIGEFAGGLAHDFNNLLTAIRGHAELAHSEAPEGSSIRADLDQVILSADRASGITRKLLAYTRRQVLEPVLLDPSELIADLIPMLSTLLGDDIDVMLHVTPRHVWVRIDPVQLEQVIVNLVVNARDAMPTGGTVTLGVKNVEEPRLERPDRLLVPGVGVRITVADTGHGMDNATIARIFDPSSLPRSSARALASAWRRSSGS
jgi:two-component system cell cycle sensor histidine kinase/response regulator CckA